MCITHTCTYMYNYKIPGDIIVSQNRQERHNDEKKGNVTKY